MKPMLATAGELPHDEAAWAFEFKWDGVRAIADVDNGAATFWSRSENNMTVAYPELAGLGRDLGGGRTVLDGEIVALDEQRRPDFGLLASRIHIADPARAAELAGHVPVTYFVFDVVMIGGTNAAGLEWSQRRRLLESLELDGAAWKVPPVFVGEGQATLDAARSLELEGVVAKRLDSLYREATRSSAWRKIKLIKRDEFVVGGWTEGSGNRAGSFGALLLGVHDGDEFRYVGSVGTGFSDQMMSEIGRLLEADARDDDPFDVGPDRPVAHFVNPTVVAEITYGEWTRDLVLRHPSFMSLRLDRLAPEVNLADMGGLGRRAQ